MMENRRNLPIGYWLKKTDELLTARIDAAQRDNGLTRLGWQILNVVRDADGATRDAIADTLRPFADAATLDRELAGLSESGAIDSSSEGTFELTALGVETYARALLAQTAIRTRAFAGVSDDEYVTTMRVLQRLVENLEREDREPGWQRATGTVPFSNDGSHGRV